VAVGVIALIGFLVGLADPAYYSPETPTDYLAAGLNSVGPFVAAAALFIWWRTTPIRRGVFLILVAAAAAFVWGLGNLIEDILDYEWGFILFGVGGITTVLASALAGVVALTVRDPFRWSGLFLLGVAAGPAADSALVWAVVWLAFVVYLGQFNQNAPANMS
jgi:hypothetical protein